MSEAVKKDRQQFGPMTFADIRHYRLPITAFISVFHRLSGVLLILFLPFILYLLDKSLTSESTFAHLQGIAAKWYVKLIILGLSWAYLHHFCAGLRHMLMDFHIGLDKAASRKSSVAVFVVSLLLTAGIALKLFGASNG